MWPLKGASGSCSVGGPRVPAAASGHPAGQSPIPAAVTPVPVEHWRAVASGFLPIRHAGPSTPGEQLSPPHCRHPPGNPQLPGPKPHPVHPSEIREVRQGPGCRPRVPLRGGTSVPRGSGTSGWGHKEPCWVVSPQGIRRPWGGPQALRLRLRVSPPGTASLSPSAGFPASRPPSPPGLERPAGARGQGLLRPSRLWL